MTSWGSSTMSGGLSLGVKTLCGYGQVPVLLPRVSGRAQGADGSSVPSAGAPASGEPSTEDGAHQNHRDTGWAGENWGALSGRSNPAMGLIPKFSSCSKW